MPRQSIYLPVNLSLGTLSENKSAVRLHTLLDLRGNIPTFIHISDGKLHEVNALDLIPLEEGAFIHYGSRFPGFLQLMRLPALPHSL
jgi:hypothetical protein